MVALEVNKLFAATLTHRFAARCQYDCRCGDACMRDNIPLLSKHNLVLITGSLSALGRQNTTQRKKKTAR